MAGTPKRLAGPLSLTASAANVYNPSANTYAIVRHIHLANTTASAKTFELFVGATAGSAAGTQLFMDYSIAANSTYDYYCSLVMTSSDFLTGLASAASNSVVITVEGELYAS